MNKMCAQHVARLVFDWLKDHKTWVFFSVDKKVKKLCRLEIIFFSMLFSHKKDLVALALRFIKNIILKVIHGVCKKIHSQKKN